MKKVKITLRPGSTGKKYYLFPNQESLYLWLCATERNEVLPVPGIEELVLEPGGFIEAELRGFEYAYEEHGKFRRLNLIRLGKASPPKNSSGLLVTIHSGWVSGGLLPLKNYTDSEIESHLITAEEAKLDLPALFKDENPAEDEDDVEVEIEIGDDEPIDDSDEDNEDEPKKDR